MRKSLYNNIGICALGMYFVLKKHETLSISKVLLIMPFITHRELLNYLSNKSTKVHSLEKLIIDKTSHFSNFNRRYYDMLTNSVNALQLLNELEIVKVENGLVSCKANLSYELAMGKRVQKIEKASLNISKLLEGRTDKIYLNLRIEL